MDRFVAIFDLVPIIKKESSCTLKKKNRSLSYVIRAKHILCLHAEEVHKRIIVYHNMQCERASCLCIKFNFSFTYFFINSVWDIGISVDEQASGFRKCLR